EENAIAAVNAIYDAAAWNESNETGGWSNEFIYNDVLSDDALKGSNPGDFPDIAVLEEWRTTTANPMPGQVWRKIFRGIFRANDVINGLTNTEGIDEEAKSKLLGEAYFFRGYFYLDAVMKFGPVPLFDGPVEPSQFNNSSRAPLGEVFAQIEADFQEAADRLPVRQDDTGRATKGAALSYLARVMMYELGIHNVNGTTWQDVFDVTTQVVNLGVYSLAPNYAEIHTLDGEN